MHGQFFCPSFLGILIVVHTQDVISEEDSCSTALCQVYVSHRKTTQKGVIPRIAKPSSPIVVDSGIVCPSYMGFPRSTSPQYIVYGFTGQVIRHNHAAGIKIHSSKAC
jgi:hypothetical protein